MQDVKSDKVLELARASVWLRMRRLVIRTGQLRRGDLVKRRVARADDTCEEGTTTPGDTRPEVPDCTGTASATATRLESGGNVRVIWDG